MTDFFTTLANEIDEACDINDQVELEKLLMRIFEYDRSTLSILNNAKLDFYCANIYASLRQLTNDDQDWAWSQPLLEKEIYCLRLALNSLREPSAPDIKTDLKLRIITNLANALDNIGRFVEAIELWDKAISEDPDFGMALGNKALALFCYAEYINDPLSQNIFLKNSYTTFKQAMSFGVEGHAAEHIKAWVDHLRSIADWDGLNLKEPKMSRGRSKAEKKYKRWCVKNRLVLNTVNDILQKSEALSDSLTLPSITLPASNEYTSLPRPYAIFNQLKQEYVSARYLVFEALQDKDAPLHFSDKETLLYDALDYRFYRLWVEKVKMAFLAAHAIFDKIAYLINDYWKLGLKIKSINFNSIWYLEGRPKLGLAKQFESSKNWPLRGLYWLSKDFYHKSNAVRVVDPDAKIIHEIRNHIAHKYLRVHDHFLYAAAEERARLGHELSYPVTDRELIEQSIKLLKLVRSALIYLSAAVAHEESEISKNHSEDFLGQMHINTVRNKYRI